MPTGVVRWFSPEKGHGFILEDGGPDFFVQEACVLTRPIGEGDRVTFDASTGPRGTRQAVNVVRIPTS